MVITRNVFDLALPPTQLLQGKSIDVMDGIELITSFKTKARGNGNCAEIGLIGLSK